MLQHINATHLYACGSYAYNPHDTYIVRIHPPPNAKHLFGSSPIPLRSVHVYIIFRFPASIHLFLPLYFSHPFFSFSVHLLLCLFVRLKTVSLWSKTQAILMSRPKDDALSTRSKEAQPLQLVRQLMNNMPKYKVHRFKCFSHIPL